MTREEFDEFYESAVIRMQKAGWLKVPFGSRETDELPLTEKGLLRQRELLRAFLELESADCDRLFADDLAGVYSILRAYAPPDLHVDIKADREPGRPPHGRN
jgi:hypothetical protein